MKKIVFLFFVIFSVSAFAQERMVAKASSAELEAVGITGSKEVFPGWRAFSTSDTTAAARALKNAGFYSEIDRKETLYGAEPDVTAGSGTFQWWITANAGLWHGSFLNAWKITTGSPSVKVGIIDSGSPLKDGVWTSSVLDSSRFIVGPSFVNATDTPVDSDWANTDYAGHATHVAGIIAALPNDSVGVAGIDQRCKVEIFKSFTEYGWGYNSSIADAIFRLTGDSCRIASMSFGSPWYSRMIEDAMRYATDRNVLCVVAAGNDGNEVQSFPAFSSRFTTYSDSGMPGVLSVGSIDPNGNVSLFSNRGYFVDIYAPGGSGVDYPSDSTDILSTWPSYYVLLDDTTNGKPVVKNYQYLAGTSMATPMVVGTASLMLSVNPKLTAAELKKIICSTADTIETSNGPIPILDPARAVQAAKDFDAVMAVRSETSMPSGFALHQNYPNPFNPTTIISFDLPKSGAVSLNVYNALGELVQTLVGGQLSAGKHGVSFDGSRLSSGVYFYRLQTAGSVFTRKMLLLK